MDGGGQRPRHPPATATWTGSGQSASSTGAVRHRGQYTGPYRAVHRLHAVCDRLLGLHAVFDRTAQPQPTQFITINYTVPSSGVFKKAGHLPPAKPVWREV
jgi:hypothetical protein